MKGQNLRIFLASSSSGTKKAIAKADSCDFTVDAQTEDSTSKDTTGDWTEYDCVSKGWSVKADCKFESLDSGAIVPGDVIDLLGQDVFLNLSPAMGTNNRQEGTALLSGKALVASVNITSANRKVVTASMSFTGNGPLS